VEGPWQEGELERLFYEKLKSPESVPGPPTEKPKRYSKDPFYWDFKRYTPIGAWVDSARSFCTVYSPPVWGVPAEDRIRVRTGGGDDVKHSDDVKHNIEWPKDVPKPPFQQYEIKFPKTTTRPPQKPKKKIRN